MIRRWVIDDKTLGYLFWSTSAPAILRIESFARGLHSVKFEYQ